MLSEILITSRQSQSHSERMDSRRYENWSGPVLEDAASLLFIWAVTESKSKLILCTMGRRVGLSSAKERTNTWRKCHNSESAYRHRCKVLFPYSRENGSPFLWQTQMTGKITVKDHMQDPTSQSSFSRSWLTSWMGKVALCRLVFSGDEVSGNTHEWFINLIRGSSTQRFQFCLDLDGNLLYSRAIQGHSGTQKVDFTLQDKV